MSLCFSHRTGRLKIELETRVEGKEGLELLEIKPVMQRPDFLGFSDPKFTLHSKSSRKPLKDYNGASDKMSSAF